MNESFLHYIWQFQYFDKENLVSSDDESLSVIKTGTPNSDAGPDFFNAKIKIDGIEWAGNVEIHIKSSDWNAHHHERDPAYYNVVLHVVWEDDRPVYLKDTVLPTLELRNRVDLSLLQNYRKLVQSTTPIACEKTFPNVEEIIKLSMLDKALMQRLEAKASQVTDLLRYNKGDWEETTHQLLAKNFGFKVNADTFFQLSKSLPYKIIQKQSSLLQVEALLFGQAGMLETKTKDEYITALFTEYNLLTQKYAFGNLRLNPGQWKFLRLRPANFPTVRIAQFASMLYHVRSIFSFLTSVRSYAEICRLFARPQSSYWKSHYRFGKKATGEVPSLGESSIQNIVINTVAPLLVAYGKYKDDDVYIERAVEFLQQLPAENNTITREWNDLGIKVNNAFDSQALLELHNSFCQRRQCLNCAIGIAILKPL
ncbi:hypothetical protein WSM22_13110 [Cytophagales bacterium WSM2-2]|nr:hypothetical protein WSM22_13110 [Cytophagales bacterium WSM2-2]